MFRGVIAVWIFTWGKYHTVCLIFVFLFVGGTSFGSQFRQSLFKRYKTHQVHASTLAFCFVLFFTIPTNTKPTETPKRKFVSCLNVFEDRLSSTSALKQHRTFHVFKGSFVNYTTLISKCNKGGLCWLYSFAFAGVVHLETRELIHHFEIWYARTWVFLHGQVEL